MIETLIVVIIILLIFGILVWAVATYLPVPQPFLGLIVVLIALIAVLICLQRLGIVNI